MLEPKPIDNPSFWTRKNIRLRDIIYFAGFIIALLGFILPLLPQRARLAVFIDYPQFTYYGGSNSFDLTVFVKAVNDSPRTAEIRTWDLDIVCSLPFNITYEHSAHYGLFLRPSSQTDFEFSKTLIGENNTLLPQTAIRSLIVTITYEDNLGIQEARTEYSFI